MKTNSILRLFRALRKVILTKPPRKNKDLEKRAREEAAKELSAESNKWQKGFTLPPGKFVPPKTSKTEQEMAKERYDHILEAKAEKKYRSMDNKYDAKLKRREEKIQLLIRKIDHTITPLSAELQQCPEANKTLLAVDWPELRKVISPQEFTITEMQEQIDRTITALKTLRCKIGQKSLINAGKWFYEVTIKAAFCSVLEWVNSRLGR